MDAKLVAWGMANNPEFANHMRQQQKQQQSVVQGQQLAEASKGINDFMQGREAAFNNTPSDVPIPMRRPEYQQPTSLQDWQTRNQMRMESGNPALQELAMKDDATMRDKLAAGPTADPMITNDMKNFFGMTKPEDRTEEAFRKYMEDKRIQRTMAVQDPNGIIPASEAMNLVDKEGNPFEPPLNLTYGQAQDIGLSRGKKMSDTAIEQDALYDQSANILDQMKYLMDAGVDVSGLSGWAEEFRSGSDLENIAADTLLKWLGKTNDPLVKEQISLTANLQNMMVKAITGAEASKEQLATIKRQLPMPGQPKAQFLANWELSKRNLEMLKQMKRKSRGKGGSANTKTATDIFADTSQALKNSKLPHAPDGVTFD